MLELHQTEKLKSEEVSSGRLKDSLPLTRVCSSSRTNHASDDVGYRATVYLSRLAVVTWSSEFDMLFWRPTVVGASALRWRWHTALSSSPIALLKSCNLQKSSLLPFIPWISCTRVSRQQHTVVTLTWVSILLFLCLFTTSYFSFSLSPSSLSSSPSSVVLVHALLISTVCSQSSTSEVFLYSSQTRSQEHVIQGGHLTADALALLTE